MNDLAYVAMLLAFFVLAALFVLACDRVVGTDDETAAVRAPGAAGGDPEQKARAA